MAALLKLVDEHFGPAGAQRRPAVELRLVSERVTPREVIRRRVEAEVEAVNARKLTRASDGRSPSLLIDTEPGSAEAILNLRVRRGRKPRLDRLEAETDRALVAFQRQRFIMLFDDRQVDDLDAEVTVTPQSQVVFLYLSPLKGG